MRIALISINQSSHSETFIRAQRNYLDGEITYMWSKGKKTEEGLIQPSNYLLRLWGIYLEYKRKNNHIQKKALKRFLLKKKIDVVLAQYGPCGVSVMDACKELNLPLVVHFHGFDAYVKETLDQHKKDYLRMFDYASTIIAVSKDMVEQLIHLGAPAKKVTYAPYGPNTTFFDVQPMFDQKTFVSIGRFTFKKAPYLTLAAFREVLDQVPDAKLIMAGGGPLEEVCHNLAHYWNISEQVIFPGAIKHEQVLEYFKHAYAFVQHSIVSENGDAEGTPVAGIEASAAALPVVATRHKGLRDVILEGKTGYLVDEKDVSSMAKAMIALCKNREKAMQMGQAGREFVKQHFTMDDYIEKLNQILKKAVQSHP